MNNEKIEIARDVYNKIMEEYEKRSSQEDVVRELGVPEWLVRKVTLYDGIKHTVRRKFMPMKFIMDFPEWEKLTEYQHCLEK